MGADRETAVVVRPSTEADVEAALDLFSAVASEGRWIATEDVDHDARRARFLESLTQQDRANFVALEGEQLVGTLAVELRSGDGGLSMVVASGHRGRGVGSALMQAAIDWAKQVGAHRLSLAPLCQPHVRQLEQSNH
jgi:GNAT superfamily N-acetyltransferase